VKLAGIVSAVVGVGVGAALIVLGPKPGPAYDGGPLAAEVDARLREAAAGLHARTATLAEIPRLSAAVATDSATVRGLTKEELAFRPRRRDHRHRAAATEDWRYR
jgi:hypothetical protein